VKRNRVAVIAGAPVVFLLLALLVQAGNKNAQLARERDKARRVAQFLSEVFRAASPEVNSGKDLKSCGRAGRPGSSRCRGVFP
jgi:hypothetical protein